MLPLPASRRVRWILLGAALLLIPYSLRSRLGSSRTRQSASGYVPNKIYEPHALDSNDNTASETTPDPQIPVFEASINNLESDVYDPYPDYNSPHWRQKWKGYHAPCTGPRNKYVNGNPENMLKAHRLKTKAPSPMFGSYKETGLESDFCFDQYARFEPYSFDGYDTESGYTVSLPRSQISGGGWDNVDWGTLQKTCLVRNQNRYASVETAVLGIDGPSIFRMPSEEDRENVDTTLVFPLERIDAGSWQGWRLSDRRVFRTRTAMVIRTWDGLEWTLDTMQHVRSLVMELSLHSGGEYEVIILLEIKDVELPIFENNAMYRETMLKSVPAEFANMTILFNRVLLERWYPKAGSHRPGNSQEAHMNQPMQLLSLLRPDIEHFWQTELDVRYTGHHYHHLETISAWADAQPRKYAWERASRYYIPAVHGSWANFSTMIEDSTVEAGVWGPEKTKGIRPVGPEPPIGSLEGEQWGAGEEADLINLAPVFDTEGSTFLFKDIVENYPEGKTRTPRRATANTMLIRFSKRLLRAMHHGQVTLGTHMPPEMYPESTALHHGLKLVQFPLPTYLDYVDSSPEQMDRIFNADDGKTVLNVPYQHSDIWHRMSYWSSLSHKTNYPEELYNRWRAYTKDSIDRLCLPGILLHPVKRV